MAARMAPAPAVDDTSADGDVAHLYRLLGETVVVWNQCEGRLRRLVVRLAGGKHPQDFALTAAAPVAGLLQILATLAEYAHPEVKEHLVHYGDCVERLHEHHLFLARGADFVGEGGAVPGARVWVSRLAGQHRLRVRHDRLDAASLERLLAELSGVSAYGQRLLAKLFPDDDSTHAASRRWPKKPALPERLGKAPPVLMGEPPGQGVTLHASADSGSCPPRLRLAI